MHSSRNSPPVRVVQITRMLQRQEPDVWCNSRCSVQSRNCVPVVPNLWHGYYGTLLGSLIVGKLKLKGNNEVER